MTSPKQESIAFSSFARAYRETHFLSLQNPWRNFVALTFLWLLFSAGLFAQQEEEKHLIFTPDGLPVEVEFIELKGSVLEVRFTASRKHFTFDIAELDQETQRGIWLEIKKCKNIPGLPPFALKLERNTNPTDMLLRQSGFLTSQRDKTKQYLFPGNYCLRLTATKGPGADVAATAHVYWYAKYQDAKTWNMALYERTPLTISYLPGDYLTKSPPFPRAAYQGYAILVFADNTGDLMWQSSNYTMFLNDARKRLGLPLEK